MLYILFPMCLHGIVPLADEFQSLNNINGKIFIILVVLIDL
jgi:hypothetical protein